MNKDRIFEMMGKINKIALNEESINEIAVNGISYEDALAKQLFGSVNSLEDIKPYAEELSQGIKIHVGSNSSGNILVFFYNTLVKKFPNVDTFIQSIKHEQAVPVNEENIIGLENIRVLNRNEADVLPGGIGDNKNPNDFDEEQITKGLEVEKEHTDNPEVALEIVMDHLTENPEYYGTDNQNPESMAQCGAEADAQNNKSEDDQLTDILLGFTPHKLGGQLPIH